MIALTDAIEKGYVFPNIYTKSEIDALLGDYNNALSGFVTVSGGVYSNPFVFSNLQNQFIGSFATNSLAINGDTITSIKSGSANSSNNEKLTTQGYVDEQLANYLTLAGASQTYQLQSDMSNYLTTLDASSTYQPKSAMSSYLTASDASSTYQTKAAMSDYLTSATATSTYQPKSAMSSYLTVSDASSTYQTKAAMNDYLTSASATSTYQPQSSMSNYLTTTSAANTYQPKGSYVTTTDLATSVATASLQTTALETLSLKLGNKTVDSINTSGNNNNTKLITQGYADATYQPAGSYLTASDITGKANLTGATFTGDVTIPTLNITSLVMGSVVGEEVKPLYGTLQVYVGQNNNGTFIQAKNTPWCYFFGFEQYERIVVNTSQFYVELNNANSNYGYVILGIRIIKPDNTRAYYKCMDHYTSGKTLTQMKSLADLHVNTPLTAGVCLCSNIGNLSSEITTASNNIKELQLSTHTFTFSSVPYPAYIVGDGSYYAPQNATQLLSFQNAIFVSTSDNPPY